MKIKPPEIIKVKADVARVECDGDGGALGHPRVFYSFGQKQQVTCKYCDRAFVKAAAK